MEMKWKGCCSSRVDFGSWEYLYVSPRASLVVHKRTHDGGYARRLALLSPAVAVARRICRLFDSRRSETHRPTQPVRMSAQHNSILDWETRCYQRSSMVGCGRTRTCPCLRATRRRKRKEEKVSQRAISIWIIRRKLPPPVTLSESLSKRKTIGMEKNKLQRQIFAGEEEKKCVPRLKKRYEERVSRWVSVSAWEREGEGAREWERRKPSYWSVFISHKELLMITWYVLLTSMLTFRV